MLVPKVQQCLELPRGSPPRKSVLRQRASCLIGGASLEDSQQIVVALWTFFRSPTGLASGHHSGREGRAWKRGLGGGRRKMQPIWKTIHLKYGRHRCHRETKEDPLHLTRQNGFPFLSFASSQLPKVPNDARMESLC